MSDTSNQRPPSVPPPTDPDGSFHQHSNEIEKSRARSATDRPGSGALPPVGSRSGRTTPGYDGRPGTASRPSSSRPGSGSGGPLTASASEEITPLHKVKKEPLPPIGAQEETSQGGSANDFELVEVDSATVASSMAGGGTGVRLKGRYPRVVSYRPEIDVESCTRSTPPDVPLKTTRSIATPEQKTVIGKDGEDMVVKSIDCQTEWSWLKDMEMVQRMSNTPGGKFSRQSTVRAPTQTPGDVNEDDDEEDPDINAEPFDLLAPGASRTSERRASRASEHSTSRASKSQKHRQDHSATTPARETPGVQPGYQDDTYGIPILELSSDSDSSDDEIFDEETYKDPSESTADPNTLPSIGPPVILQYQRESEKKKENAEDDQKGTPASTETVFEGKCEFCGSHIKPFPSLEDQKLMAPEELYCCDDYREFLELMLTSNQPPLESKLIDITPHAPHGSKQARRAAKERAAQRPRPVKRSLLQSKPKFTLKKSVPQLIVIDLTNTETQGLETDSYTLDARSSERPTPTPRSNNLTVTMREREIQRQQAAITGTGGFGGGGGASNFYHLAQKMKTINYQLSSQKCLEEGWTLRPPSPLLEQEPENEVFEPQPLLPPWAEDASKDRKEAGLVQKYYPDGSPFVILFPDGTGNAFYPSGRVAISISCVERGLYTYLAHADSDEDPNVLAVFDPDGHATSYYNHGGVRVCLDPYGGMELDARGCRKRKWSWKEQVEHVHAPPIQPITFAITPHLSIRIMSQENISLTFTHSAKSCRFQVGARLKLVARENVPPTEVDEDMLFREEVKNRIETLFSKVSNLLKFPKCPKLDKLPGPAHITAREEKTQKLRQSFGRSAKAEKDKKGGLPVIRVN